MKKKLTIILSLVLAMSLCLGILTACAKGLSIDQLDKLYNEFQKDHRNEETNTAVSYYVNGSVSYLEDGGNELIAKVKWTIEGTTAVTVGETNSMGNVQIVVPANVEADIDYKLVGTLVDEDGNPYKNADGNPYKLELTKKVPAKVGGGTEYKLAIRQLALGSVIYATATADHTYYVGSINSQVAAATFYTEDVEGGKKIYTLVNGVKSYLGAKIGGGHNNIVLGGIVNDTNAAAYEGSVWTVSENEIKTVVDGTTLYLGTYGKNQTFSVSTSKTYPAFLVPVGTEVKAQAEVSVSEQNANSTVTFTSPASTESSITVDVGTTVTFTVTPAENYEIVSVKNGDTVLTATSGNSYSVVADASVTIIVDAKPIGSNGETSPVSGVVDNAIPAGWTYIPNNPAYPNPSYYGNGGLKMNYTDMGLSSPELDGATGYIQVVVKINALNKKSDTTAPDHVFKIEGLDASGEVVVTDYIDSAIVGDNSITIDAGTAVVKTIKVVMVGFPLNGDGIQSNVNLGGVTIIWGPEVEPPVVDNSVAKIGDTEYATLEEAITATKAAEGKTVITLLKDVTCGGIMFVSADAVNVEFDLNGHTLTVGKPLVGSAGTVSQSLHFEKGNTVVIKNGTIACENNSASMLLQNYCDLTLDGVTLDGSNLAASGTAYTLSNNCGTILIKGGSVIKARATNGVAFDLWYGMNKDGLYDNGVSVTVEAGCTINGKIEYGAASRVTGTDWIEKTVLVLPEGEYTIEYTCNLVTNANANITIGGVKIGEVSDSEASNA